MRPLALGTAGADTADVGKKEAKARVGAVIARFRQQACLTQAQLAEHLDCAERTVRAWERGVRGVPEEQVVVLARVLGIEDRALRWTTYADPIAPAPAAPGVAAATPDDLQSASNPASERDGRAATNVQPLARNVSNRAGRTEEVEDAPRTAPAPQEAAGGQVAPTEEARAGSLAEAEQQVAALVRRIVAGNTGKDTMVQFLMTSTLMRDVREAAESRTREIREKTLQAAIGGPRSGGADGEQPSGTEGNP